MRKVILGFAAAALVISCKKIQAGGNKGVLKMEEGVERYDSHENRSADVHENAANSAAAQTAVVTTDSTAVKPAATVSAEDTVTAK